MWALVPYVTPVLEMERITMLSATATSDDLNDPTRAFFEASDSLER